MFLQLTTMQNLKHIYNYEHTGGDIQISFKIQTRRISPHKKCKKIKLYYDSEGLRLLYSHSLQQGLSQFSQSFIHEKVFHILPESVNALCKELFSRHKLKCSTQQLHSTVCVQEVEMRVHTIIVPELQKSHSSLDNSFCQLFYLGDFCKK